MRGTHSKRHRRLRGRIIREWVRTRDNFESLFQNNGVPVKSSHQPTTTSKYLLPSYYINIRIQGRNSILTVLNRGKAPLFRFTPRTVDPDGYTGPIRGNKFALKETLDHLVRLLEKKVPNLATQNFGIIFHGLIRHRKMLLKLLRRHYGLNISRILLTRAPPHNGCRLQPRARRKFRSRRYRQRKLNLQRLVLRFNDSKP